MATSSKRKGTSVQTCRFSSRLAIRLEYDHADQRQSVFLNGELRSSFHCPVAFRAEHTFRGHDGISEERGHFSEWRMRFAAEQNTYRIRYELQHRSTDGDDTKWYWWDRNLEPDDWTRFPACDEGEQIEVECETCGRHLQCPECSRPQPIQCENCGTKLACPKCDAPEAWNVCPQCEGPISGEMSDGQRSIVVYDATRMQEEIQQLDADRLQALLADAIGSQVDDSTSWVTVLEQVLSEAGCDVSSVRLDITPGEECE